MSCGRTKAEALVTEVLAPKAVQEAINKLKSAENTHLFSIQTDAFNKTNHKMFPLAVHFFTAENGVMNKLILLKIQMNLLRE